MATPNPPKYSGGAGFSQFKWIKSLRQRAATSANFRSAIKPIIGDINAITAKRKGLTQSGHMGGYTETKMFRELMKKNPKIKYNPTKKTLVKKILAELEPASQHPAEAGTINPNVRAAERRMAEPSLAQPHGLSSITEGHKSTTLHSYSGTIHHGTEGEVAPPHRSSVFQSPIKPIKPPPGAPGRGTMNPNFRLPH